MGDLYGRTWRVRVGDLDVSDLDLEFVVRRSTKSDPNSGEITIYNLSQGSRARVSRASSVSLAAGYGEDPPLLFSGDVRTVEHPRAGLDVKTVIQARDGGRAYASAPISKSYPPGTATRTVLRDALQAMGVGEGNLTEFERSSLSSGARAFPDGYTASGPAHRVLGSILSGAGLRWSVQHRALQIQRRGEALDTQVVLLSPDSGLVESPTVDKRGRVEAVALIQPGLDPGRRVRLDSRDTLGTFEILSAEYSGQTRGDEWHATLTLDPVS